MKALKRMANPSPWGTVDCRSKTMTRKGETDAHYFILPGFQKHRNLSTHRSPLRPSVPEIFSGRGNPGRGVRLQIGKFPGTVPSMFLIMHLQAQHLDLDFYDKFYQPGAYLKTHSSHRTDWHSDNSE
jgi:hypothetical protein